MFCFEVCADCPAKARQQSDNILDKEICRERVLSLLRVCFATLCNQEWPESGEATVSAVRERIQTHTIKLYIYILHVDDVGCRTQDVRCRMMISQTKAFGD